MIRHFRVINGPLTVRIGSTVENEAGREVLVPVDTVLALQQVSPSGNVWFLVPSVGRAKVEAGSIERLVKIGAVEEVPS